MRNFKYFDAGNFQTDLRNQRWEVIGNYPDVDGMWKTWNTLFLNVLDKPAPVREKRVKNKQNVPCLTSVIFRWLRYESSGKCFLAHCWGPDEISVSQGGAGYMSIFLLLLNVA